MLPSITQDLIHHVVPSHQPLINKGLICPLMLPPIDVHLHHSPSLSRKFSTSPVSSCTTISSSPSPRRNSFSPTLQQLFSSVSLTGNWQTDEAIVNGHKLHAPVLQHPCVLDTSSLDASIISPSTQSCQLTKELRKIRRSKSHPYIAAIDTPRMSSRMRFSASPIKGWTKKPSRSKPAQLKPAEPKPPLACIFCCGCKIACRAPPAESDKKTCQWVFFLPNPSTKVHFFSIYCISLSNACPVANLFLPFSQCDKRGLHCSFPLESYRGMWRWQAKARKILAKGVLNWS